MFLTSTDIDLFIGLPPEQFHRCAKTYLPSLWSIVECRNWDMLGLIVQMALGFSGRAAQVIKLLTNPGDTLALTEVCRKS